MNAEVLRWEAVSDGSVGIAQAALPFALLGGLLRAC
jgi:hypothetical protein